jgi:hypothetical protein
LLAGRELTLGRFFLRLQLGALGVNTAVLDGVQAELGGRDGRLGRVDS